MERRAIQGGNITGSHAPPASTVNKITWSRYVILDSLISSPALVEGASKALMLPPCICVGAPSSWANL